MKQAAVITNASKNCEDETVIFTAAGYTGIVAYYLHGITIEIDFDGNTIKVTQCSSQIFTWDATPEDLTFHDMDFAIYITGTL